MVGKIAIIKLWPFVCSLFTYMSLTDLVYCVTKQPNVLPDITSLCPHRQFCNGPPTKNLSIEYKDSCCQACSCAPDCHVVGSCCPDVQHDARSRPTYPCQNIADLLNAGRNVSLKSKDDRMYRIIDDCPNENISMQFPGCVQPIKLQDFVIVSDRANQKMFKNSDCSLCHGTADFIEWGLKTECKHVPLTYFQTFEQRDEYILHNCVLTALPPNKIIDDIARCFTSEPMIRECHGGKQLTAYDKLMKAECHKDHLSQNTVYFVEDNIRRRVYKNVYCYLCNQVKEEPMTDICTARVHDSLVRQFSLVSFSGVLTMSKHVSSYENVVPSKCKSEEKWDPFVRRCRVLHCPLGKIPIYGHCRSSTKYSFGLSLIVRFEIILERGQLTDRDIVVMIDKHPPVLFSDRFKCGQCTMMFFTNANGQKLYFEQAVFTNKACSLDSLLLRIREAVTTKKRAFSVKYRGKVHHFVIKSIPGDILNKTYLPIAALSYHFQCVDIIQTNLHMIQNCPRFKISITFFQTITRNDTSISKNITRELLAIQNNDKRTIFICAEEYFRLAALLNGSREVSIIDMTVKFLFLQIVFSLL